MFRSDPIQAILEALKINPEGLTLLSLAQVTGLHRHTCTKYVMELVGAGVVYQRDVGAAKLCYLSKKIEGKAEENRIAEELKRKRSGGYHIKLLVAVVLLTFLLSETVIIAYENSSLLNETNFSDMNTSPVTSTYNISDLNEFFNISSEAENITVEPPTVQNLTETVELVENTNGSSNSQNNAENSTLAPANLTGNDTFSDENVTLNETNTTVDEPSIEPPVIEPKFDVKLAYPQRITRGESVQIRADVTSDTLARNVYLRWVLPEGFEIVSGNDIETCGDLGSMACVSEISVRTEMSDIGLNEIKVVISYEK